jgi:hypothetical protein
MTGFYPRAVAEAESLIGLPVCSDVAAAVPVVASATLSRMAPPRGLDHVRRPDRRQRPALAGL